MGDVATGKGLEPSTSGVTGRRSNRLNHPAESVWTEYSRKKGTCQEKFFRHLPAWANIMQKASCRSKRLFVELLTRFELVTSSLPRITPVFIVL